MALNDNFAVMLGDTNDTRQPAAGVFEKLSSIMKVGTTDAVIITDATLDSALFALAINTAAPQGDAAATRQPSVNMGLRIGNVVFIEKNGTTDHVAISGVQTDE